MNWRFGASEKCELRLRLIKFIGPGQWDTVINIVRAGELPSLRGKYSIGGKTCVLTTREIKSPRKKRKVSVINPIKLYWLRGADTKNRSQPRGNTEKNSVCVMMPILDIELRPVLVLLIKWYIDVLNVSEAMIKMCGNKEVVFVAEKENEIKELPLISFLGIAVCLFRAFWRTTPARKGIPFCLSNDNGNKWQIMPYTLLRLFAFSHSAPDAR